LFSFTRKLVATVLPIALAVAFVASTAIGIYGSGPAVAVAAADDARDQIAAELNQDAREIRLGQETLKVDRYVYREEDNFIAGIVKVADFAAWDKAMRNDPENLQHFLKGIADEVAPLAEGSRLELSWMVLDVVDAKPANFELHELTALSEGKWGVIRPLAHTACLYCRFGGRYVYVSTISYTGSGPATYRWRPGAVYFPDLSDLSAFAATASSTPAEPDKPTQAMEILNQGFRETRIHGITLKVAGYSTQDAPKRTIVGMIKLSEYPNWERAMREYPEELSAWLSSAARRVQSLAINTFELSWGVVDQTVVKPKGFTDSEVVRRTDRKYLVVRPLAYTWNAGAHDRVELRPASSMPTASEPVAANWKPGTTVYLPTLSHYAFASSVPIMPSVGRPPLASTPLPDPDDRNAINSMTADYATRTIAGSTVAVSEVYETGTLGAPSMLIFLSEADYANWEQALYLDEAGLADWLFDMTEAARKAGGRKYQMTWAVVDVVELMPLGFATWEVADVHYSRKLLVRTLAVTVESADGTGIAIRTPAEMPNSVRKSMSAGSADWVTTRRPMLFFNETGDSLELRP
jgi:hypothetical protein